MTVQLKIAESMSRQRMSEADMRSGIAKLAPFHHAIDLPFGLNTYDETKRGHERQSLGRIDSFKKHVWGRLLDHFGSTLKGKRVLDVACNCGGFSMLAADAGAEVRGFDSENHYIDQARFVQAARGNSKVRFDVDQLENVSAERYGNFDISFFFGILYHLEDPIGGLKRVASLTSDMIVVDTHLMRLPLLHRLIKKPLWSMSVVEPVQGPDTTTGLWRKAQHCQFKPNREAVEAALRFVGFDDVEYLEPTAKGLEDRYYKQTRGVFIARKRSGNQG